MLFKTCKRKYWCLMDHLDHTKRKHLITISLIINRWTHKEAHSIPSRHRQNNLKKDADNKFLEKLFLLAGVLSMVECAHQDLVQLFHQLLPLYQTIKTLKTSKMKKPQLQTLLLLKLSSIRNKIFFRDLDRAQRI